jgi:transposase
MNQAYIWNFYAASQIVLRESLVDVIEYIATIRSEGDPDDDGATIIRKQREWVDVLSAAILKSFPQLLGFAYRHERPGRPRLAQQGRMAGRLFALFSMWVVQRAKYTSAQHKQIASEVISWINSRHELQ